MEERQSGRLVLFGVSFFAMQRLLACTRKLQFDTICIKVCRFSLPSILQDMGTARVTSSVVSCNSAITACDKAGQWERALHLFTSLPRSDRHVSSDEHGLFCYDVGQKTIQNGNRNNYS